LDVIASSPVVAETYGVRVQFARTWTFIVAALISGIAGTLWAMSFYVVTPESFNFFGAIAVAATVVVGGTRHWIGPLLGALLLGLISIMGRDLPNWGSIVSGTAMVATVTLYPDGIGGYLRSRLRQRLGSGGVAHSKSLT
jgi:branched-chain amino acid transport system permease protein